MSDATPTGDGGTTGVDEPDGGAGAGPGGDDGETHSRLVGLMAMPVSSSVPVRRSTVLMAVAFLGFGVLMAIYPPASKTSVTVTSNNPDLVPGIVPASTTTTTTHPTTTTTTEPVPTTTTTHPTTTTTTTPAGSSTTTTTRVSTTTTTVAKGGTTTTAPGATTTAPGG